VAAVTTLVSIETVPDIVADPVPPAPEPDLSQLALALFDLRAAYEAHLRTLTCMQRNLERIRRPGSVAGEADLLLGEMARHLATLEASRHELDSGVVTAERCLEDVLGSFKELTVRCRPTDQFLPEA
jgi:hypothetical protein